jgi:hypothetical protein
MSRIELSNIDFIAHAFYRCGADEVPWVTGFPGDPGEIHHGMWGGRSALPLPRFICAGNNNYVAVSRFKRGSDCRHHRRKDCFSAMDVVMVDDVGTKVAFDKLGLEPTCLVETSPGNFQAWYFLTEPERDRLRAEALIKGMIASGLTTDGADPGMNGVTRYGRLPVGINGKAKYRDKRGAPFKQRVAHWVPEVRYGLDEIAAAYGVDLVTADRPRNKARVYRQATPGALPAGEGLVSLLEQAGLYIEGLPGTPGGHRIICPWVHEHTDQDETGTVYFEPGDENNGSGGFKCHHGHCQGRTIADLNHFVIRLLQTQKEE